MQLARSRGGPRPLLVAFLPSPCLLPNTHVISVLFGRSETTAKIQQNIYSFILGVAGFMISYAFKKQFFLFQNTCYMYCQTDLEIHIH